jgi:transposase
MSEKKTKKKKVKVKFERVTDQKLILPFNLLLANKFLNAIGFVDFIDRSVKWDPKRWTVSPGNLAKAVILVTFLQIRSPLYKIHQSFIGIDTEALFGKGVMPEHLNDDAIGRALDRINDAKPEGLFSSLCLSLYTKYNIAFNRLHSDTTTLSFYGQYEQDEDIEMDEENLSIVKGYNKDHRPQCKQVVVGKIVNEHGLAVASSTMDGNTSDVEWNKKAIKLVKETFGQRLNEMTYIADSKLITMPNFKLLMEPERKLRFISRCPANFHNKIEKKLIKQAYEKNNWVSAGKLGSGKKACTYKIQEFIENIEGYDTRFIVVHSSAGEKRFEGKLEKQRQELEKDITNLEKKQFACEADAREEWERFRKTHKKSLFLYDVDFNEIKIEKRPPGNPGKNPKPPKVEVTWKISARIEKEDTAAVETFKHEEECFVLITSIEIAEINGIEVLRQYKEQSVVEIQFKLMKEPAIASTIFLKTPGRINALVMLLNVSLLIRALIQYKIRKGISESKEELPRIGWDKRKLTNPTINFVLEALQSVCLTKIGKDSYRCELFNDINTLRIMTILKLLDINIEDFLDE